MTADDPSLPPLTFNAWWRWDFLKEDLQGIQPRTVLEIGPGEGAMACRLARLSEYTGLELSDRTREIARQRLKLQGTPSRMIGSMDELENSEQFDLVCAFEVLEHIEQDDEALREWSQRVRPGGWLVLSVPAEPHRMGAGDRLAGHIRRYTAQGLAQQFDGAGLVDARVRQTGFPIAYATEAVRNMVASRRLARLSKDEASQIEDLTEASSSLLQPPQWIGGVTGAITWPGRYMQRKYPNRGPGLYGTARVPASND